MIERNKILQRLGGVVVASRISCLPFTIVWPVLAACSYRLDLPRAFEFGILLIALSYNSIGYIVNDVLGLERDRFDPVRQAHPMIAGSLSARSAIVFSVLQLPFMFLVHWLCGFPVESIGWLFGSVALVFVYNLYCKSCAFPPAMELVLATAALLLGLYGASIFGELNWLAFYISLFGFFFLLSTNGFYNHLRDVDYEIAAGSITLAIYLGSKGTEGNQLHIPAALAWYGRIVQAGMIVSALVVAIELSLGGTEMMIFTLASLLNFALCEFENRASRPYWDTFARLHILVMILPLLIAMTPLISLETVFFLIIVYLLPMFVMNSTRSIISKGKYDSRENLGSTPW